MNRSLLFLLAALLLSPLETLCQEHGHEWSL